MILIKLKYPYYDSIVPVEDDIVPESQETLENGSYRAVTSPKSGFQSSRMIQYNYVDYEETMRSQFDPNTLRMKQLENPEINFKSNFDPYLLRKENLKKLKIPGITWKEADKKHQKETKCHFVVRVRELQRILLGEGNNFELNENKNDSIQTRLQEKRCVVSGEQLKDQSKICNYDDELLEQLYINLQNHTIELKKNAKNIEKEENDNPIQSKIFPEKNIGEIDNDKIRPGTVPDYLQPVFNGSLFVDHLASWQLSSLAEDLSILPEDKEKEDLQRVFNVDAIKNLLKKDLTWIVEKFENPYDA